LILQSSSLIGQCPVNMNIPVQKLGPFWWPPKHKMTIFSKRAITILIKFQ
jgi:hypothetical protein